VKARLRTRLPSPVDPIVIIGAPRSGTNMLRDVLSALPGMTTWPCDEIDPIWRHGNTRVPHDEFGPEHARPEVRRFITRKFVSRARRGGTPRVVEKTCANSLRVPFVDRVLPNARFVSIRRDGRDAIPSAMERWTATTDLRYTAEKARFVPASDVVRYAARFAGRRLARLRSDDARLGAWGPQFAGMTELSGAPLIDLCAMQWARCVDKAASDLAALPTDRVVEVRYESFVAEPAWELRRVLDRLNHRVPDARIDEAVRMVTSDRVGTGRQRLSGAEVDRIEALVGATMQRVGYG
jgi:hypothetical protein